MTRPIFAANWKMNLTLDEGKAFAETFSKLEVDSSKATLIVAPQILYMAQLEEKMRTCGIALCSQNVGPEIFGAYTGEVSPASLKEIGCEYVLVGHSERRHVFRESEELLSKKLNASLAQGMKVIFCIGELLEERKKGLTFEVLENQLKLLNKIPSNDLTNVIVAYEPVWAIGTGETATPAQAEESHQWIRKNLSKISASSPILYGGSVKSENAAELMLQPTVDGLLIGGASLKANQFAEIIKKGLESKT